MNRLFKIIAMTTCIIGSTTLRSEVQSVPFFLTYLASKLQDPLTQRHLATVAKGLAIGAIGGIAAKQLIHKYAIRAYPDYYRITHQPPKETLASTRSEEWDKFAWGAGGSILINFACSWATGTIAYALSTQNNTPLLLLYGSAGLGYALGSGIAFSRYKTKQDTAGLVFVTVASSALWTSLQVHGWKNTTFDFTSLMETK